MATRSFHIGDYLVFGATIVISLGIGIYYALSGGRQRTTKEYLVGGRQMSYIPICISLMVSFESSILMLGQPAEAYVYGIQYGFMGSIAYFFTQYLSVDILVPLFHPLKITSAYEYLELRFRSRKVRLIGTALGILTYTWYMGIVLFGPAVALEAVTGFPQWSSIFVISAVAVMYTSVGGLKAVVWADVFQCLVMWSGIFSILIKGTIDAGGPKAVWNLADKGGRLNFFVFNPDPRTRHTFWSILIGVFVRAFGMSFNQSTVQRVISTKSRVDARRALFLVIPMFFFTGATACYEGIVAYAYYQAKGCDPFESKQITNPNQVIPLMVMDIFEYLPGMPGLFLASLFSASLSTLSSGLSSLSALLWTDIIHPLIGPDISERKATIITKFSVVGFGILACCVAIIVAEIGGTLTQISASVLSAFSGPLTGLFFLACMFPRCKASSTILGGIVGFALTTWISLGMNFSRSIKKTPWLPPASTDNCPMENFLSNGTDQWLSQNYTGVYSNVTAETATSFTVMTSTMQQQQEPDGIEQMYTISYLWLGVIGTFSTMIVAVVTSFCLDHNKPGDVDPRYLLSMTDAWLPYLPRKAKDFIKSIGPQYIQEEFKERFQDPAKNLEVPDTELEIKPMLDKNSTLSDEKDHGHDPDEVKVDGNGDLNTAANHHEDEASNTNKDNESKTNGLSRSSNDNIPNVDEEAPENDKDTHVDAKSPYNSLLGPERQVADTDGTPLDEPKRGEDSDTNLQR